MICFLSSNVFAIDDYLNKDHIKHVLSEMVKADQAIRSDIVFLNLDACKIAEMQKIDLENTTILKEILTKYDWLTISEFGPEADHNAWLLLQHADQDQEFQKEILKRLEKLYLSGETNAQNFAYLYDRIAIKENRLQKYGTQGFIKDGKWVPYDTEDIENLDSTRETVGLSSFSEYLKCINQLYNLKND